MYCIVLEAPIPKRSFGDKTSLYDKHILILIYKTYNNIILLILIYNIYIDYWYIYIYIYIYIYFRQAATFSSELLRPAPDKEHTAARHRAHVSVCVCIYIYICIHTSIHICIYVYMYICIYTYTCMCIYIYIYAYHTIQQDNNRATQYMI